MRIAFMGTPEFAVPTLKALVEAGHDVPAVYTQPPRRAGRGKLERPTPIALCAEELGLQIHTPLNFKDRTDREAFAALNLDVAVVVAYGLILPQGVLDAPKHGCFNLHASLLPRWRGAAPIHRAIMAGDAETGVCVMRMAAGLDTGPVALTARTTIADDDTTQSLHDRLSTLGSQLIVKALKQLSSGDLILTDQPENGVYAAKIEKTEARIDWTVPAAEVDRKIRGLSPFPGAWFELDGKRVKVLQSRLGEADGEPGVVADEELSVCCGKRSVQLIRLQQAGKSPMNAREFLRGSPVPVGKHLT